MRSSLRARLARVLGATALTAALLLPAASLTSAADPLVLKVATDQKLEVLNPWNSVTYADYETYQINYDTLVSWGDEFEPVAGFAESWAPSADGKTWTFKIRDGMKWSDGTPATCEDARFTYQTVLDAAAKKVTLGQGYLEPYLTNAGLASVTCTDPQTLVVTTEFANPIILQAYVPILPKHIWGDLTLEEFGGEFKNDPPVVGTGAYQAAEWEAGNFIRFVRNPNYWGKTGAADEIILQHFDATDTMVQALKSGEVDYVRGVQPDQFDALKSDPNITTVQGAANGYTYLAYNLYPKDIKGGGASTTALRDPAFRDALNRAVDNDVLVDKILGGYGTAGSTQVPPFHSRFFVPPTDPRTFDIEEAKTRLLAAGYLLDAQGKRLDKDGKPITLRLTWPDSEGELSAAGEFITEWWGQLGITVDAQVTEEGKLIDQLLLPEAGGKADWDTYMWGWGGDPDPTSLLRIFTTDEIGGLNDTGYSNPEYDALAKQQVAALDETERKAIIQQMQEIFYRDAVYEIPYYDAELHAYRTDKFGGWRNQPPTTGTPFFGFGYGGYTALTDLAAATPAPSVDTAAPSGAVTPTAAPSAATDGSTTSGGSDNTTLILAVVVIAVVVVAGVALARRRAAPQHEEE